MYLRTMAHSIAINKNFKFLIKIECKDRCIFYFQNNFIFIVLLKIIFVANNERFNSFRKSH